MSKLSLLVANAENANDTILIEINGGNDWVKETSTAIHGFFDALQRHVPFEVTNAEQAQSELRDAFAMAEDGNSYLGEVVTTAISVE